MREKISSRDIPTMGSWVRMDPYGFRGGWVKMPQDGRGVKPASAC
jgi:hypothetical protein